MANCKTQKIVAARANTKPDKVSAAADSETRNGTKESPYHGHVALEESSQGKGSTEHKKGNGYRVGKAPELQKPR